MLETIVVLTTALFAFGFLLKRRGDRQPAEPKSTHASYLLNLDEGELRLGYNETITGIGMAGFFGWSVSRIREEVEIALSLRVLIAKSTGEKFTIGDKGKLRMDLTKAASSSRRGNTQHARGCINLLRLDDEPAANEDRARLDDAIEALRNSL
jgi:hypothetical protein